MKNLEINQKAIDDLLKKQEELEEFINELQIENSLLEESNERYAKSYVALRDEKDKKFFSTF